MGLLIGNQFFSVSVILLLQFKLGKVRKVLILIAQPILKHLAYLYMSQ